MNNDTSEKPEFVYQLSYVDTHFTQHGWKRIRRILRDMGATDIRSNPDTETIPSHRNCTLHATFLTKELATDAARAVDKALDWAFHPSIQQRRPL